ncbi:MAG: TIGR01777 family oxidoreductase [Planctomycetota bacterium]
MCPAIQDGKTGVESWSGRRIVLAGGSGFLGTALAGHFSKAGAQVVVLTRQPKGRADGIREMAWDGRTVGPWHSELDGAALLVNLAGFSVNCRHTPEHRRLIVDSRVHSVEALGSALARVSSPPPVWLQSSSLAIYGNTGEAPCDEDAPHGGDFSTDVCHQWEGALARCCPSGVRSCLLRIGIVLGTEGGALPVLTRLTRWGLGGSAGNGRQHISWIHVEDFIQLVDFLARTKTASGVFNVVSPGSATNAEFMRTLRRALDRPWSPPAPAWAVKLGSLFLGTESHLILEGRRGLPRRALEAGFSFRHPTLEGALADLYPRKPHVSNA